jgi:hypothetical protein
VTSKPTGHLLRVRFVNVTKDTVFKVLVGERTPLIAPRCGEGYDGLHRGDRLRIGSANVPTFTPGEAPYPATFVYANVVTANGVVTSVARNRVSVGPLLTGGSNRASYPARTLSVVSCTEVLPVRGGRPTLGSTSGLAPGQLVSYLASGATNPRAVAIDVLAPVDSTSPLTQIPGPGPCNGSKLQGSGENTGPGAGSIIQRITLKNVGVAACILVGYPKVEMLDAAGTPLPTQDLLPAPGFVAPAVAGPLTVLASGADASFTLTYSDGNQLPPSYSCPTSAQLAVTPEGSPSPVIFPYAIEPLPYVQGQQCGWVTVEAIGS